MCAYLHKGEFCSKAKLAENVYNDLTNIIDNAYNETLSKAQKELTDEGNQAALEDVAKGLAEYKKFLLDKLASDVYKE